MNSAFALFTAFSTSGPDFSSAKFVLTLLLSSVGGTVSAIDGE
jgi:hypothetical protein